jgi:hypothetical protein
MTKLLVAMACLAAAVLLVSCGEGESKSRSLRLEISSSLGEEGGSIPVEVVLHNDGSTAVSVVPPSIVPNIVRFTVFDVDAREVPFSGPRLFLGPVSRSAIRVVEPGEAIRQVFDLRDYYDFQRGTHSVSARYQNIDSGEESGVDVEVTTLDSQTIQIEVP